MLSQSLTWDMKSYFPEFNKNEMIEFKIKLTKDTESLKLLIEQMPDLNITSGSQWERVFLDRENLFVRVGHLSSYITCLEAAYADVEAYSLEHAWLARLIAELEKIDTDILFALKKIDEKEFNIFISREKIKEIAYSIKRSKKRSMHLMSREKEILTSDLSIFGFHSWGRLYNKLTGKMEFNMTFPDGRKESKSMSQWRSLMANPDRNIGKAAFEGGNISWQKVEDVCAQALNSITGNRLTLYKHKKIDHYLDTALFEASIEKETFDAMYQAVYDNIEIAREIIRSKANFFGRRGIWFFEREAPLPLENNYTLNWSKGVEMVAKAFYNSYPKLYDYFNMALKNRWIEAEPRPGKRPGAFCTGSKLIREQRVYMTFNNSLKDVVTLAHEVGHAWHGHLISSLRPFAQRYPMTLAETASTFTEQILSDGMYSNSDINDSQKLMMLDSDLGNAAVFLLDITTRLEFEKAFYEERESGEVSVSRLKTLMAQTQRKIFGNALLEDGEDPYFWASKLHFYITTTSFYNFPYTFGYLLSRSLISMFKKQGFSFLPRYETFLSLAGSETVENVVMKSLEVDIKNPAFWADSIKSLTKQLEQYKKLISLFNP